MSSAHVAVVTPETSTLITMFSIPRIGDMIDMGNPYYPTVKRVIFAPREETLRAYGFTLDTHYDAIVIV